MRKPPVPALPPLLATIAELAGEPAALAIARRYGGTRVTVPARAEGENWLTQMVDRDVAVALIDALGGGRRVDVPLGPEGHYSHSRQGLDRRFDELLAEGMSNTAIARLLGVTDRTIRNKRRARRSRAKADAATGQGDLFN